MEPLSALSRNICDLLPNTLSCYQHRFFEYIADCRVSSVYLGVMLTTTVAIACLAQAACNGDRAQNKGKRLFTLLTGFAIGMTGLLVANIKVMSAIAKE